MSSEEPRTHQGDLAPEIDTTAPSVARVYDYLIGGSENYEVDRELCAPLLDMVPEIRTFGREHRDWLGRVARFLAESAKIDQFLDCGSGLPTSDNTHQIVQRINPHAKVVYVDHDPAVVQHSTRLLRDVDNTAFVAADLTEPETLLTHPEVTGLLDLARPVGLIQCSTLHHVPDAERPHEILARYIDLLASGSYVALTHFHDAAGDSGTDELSRRIEDVFVNSPMGSGFFRSRADIAAFFDGLELIEPGLTWIRNWWPDGPHLTPAADIDRIVLGGVGRKP